jgi:hypothetical protein
MVRFINGGFSPEVAQSILRLDFAKKDHVRMAKLQAKASAGTLTEKDKEKLNQYLRMADMLAILQSKARRSLQPRKGA